MDARLRQHLSRLSTVAAAALTVPACVAVPDGAGAATRAVTSTVARAVTSPVTSPQVTSPR